LSRDQIGHTIWALSRGVTSGDVPGYATRVALRELGRRAVFLDGQLKRPGELIVPLVTARAPGLLALYGIGPSTAALLLIAAGDHPERLRSEAAWAHLCAAAPIPASSGKVTRHRLNPGGDRQASHALWRIVFTRMGSDAATRAYAGRRLTRRPRGRPDPIFGCREPAGLRTSRPSNEPPAVPGLIFLTCWRDLIRAFPHPGGPSLSCPQPSKLPGQHPFSGPLK
jgi:hypothetical protein